MTLAHSLPVDVIYPVDTVIFDLDGTLVDSATGTVNALKQALQHYGVEHPDDATMRALLGSPLPVTFRDDYNLPDQHIEEAIAIFREHAREHEFTHNTVYPGILELLESLQGAGVTIALATSKTIPTAVLTLEHAELIDFFTVIGGSEMHGPRVHKDEIIRFTLDTLVEEGVDVGSAVMVGDTTFDIQGAIDNSIPGIGVLWGYGSRKSLANAGAIRTMQTPGDLIHYLLDA